MKYRIYYRFNNGVALKEEIEATSGIKALKKAKSHDFLKQVMYQTGSEGRASAYDYEDGKEKDFPSAVLYCRYSHTGKWHAHYIDYKRK